ncbi:MAG: hypothetical protein OEL89_03585 [Candidatus Peregrinibacteria bacterium]|nr:hypothetical protein [Candidatus Peregrinibacteria bacterium]
MNISIVPKEDNNAKIKKFMRDHGLHKIIAVSGGADSSLHGVLDDDPLQKQYSEFASAFEERVIGDALGMFRGYRIAILTGGTKWGVPKTAIMKAKEYGIMTIGIYPKTGEKYALGKEFLDLAICVEPFIDESRWGDESPMFTKLLDGVIVFGGGHGTLIECSHLMKMNEALIKYDKPKKFIVPIAGTGGVADSLFHIWAKPDIRAKSMPKDKVHSGRQAGRILIQELNLDDYYDPSNIPTTEEKEGDSKDEK